jgi:hypothetical protein
MPKGMQAIYTVNLTTAGSFFYFNNIPQTYTDLKVLFSFKDNSTNTGSYLTSSYNNDNGTNYSYTMLYQSIVDYGTSVIAGRGSNETYHAWARFATSATTFGGAYTTLEIDYPNYTSNTFKQIHAGISAPSNSSTTYSSAQYAQLWRNSSPIKSIAFSSPNVFANGATATLYGIAR